MPVAAYVVSQLMPEPVIAVPMTAMFPRPPVPVKIIVTDPVISPGQVVNIFRRDIQDIPGDKR
jgi:hypothetical protein